MNTAQKMNASQEGNTAMKSVVTHGTIHSESRWTRWILRGCLSLTVLAPAMLGWTEVARAQATGTTAVAAPANTLGPQELVENSAKKMLEELDKNRATYQKDPAKLDSLVGNVLLPNFDSEYSARLVLGQSWRTATPEQRKRFVDAFYHSLLHNYGTALLNFTADKFVILPYKGDPSAVTATVRTMVKKSAGDNVPVNFELRKTDAGWKAWDVVIEGISYVKSFRTDFAAEIQQQGLDEVINRLEADGKVRANAGAPGVGH